MGDVFERTFPREPYFNKGRFGVATQPSPFPDLFLCEGQYTLSYSGEGHDKHPKSVCAVYGQYVHCMTRMQFAMT